MRTLAVRRGADLAVGNLIYVIGHRNPDTDSACSAIAYARLKNTLGEPDVRPARAGELNAETAFVLDYFDVPVPDLLTDAAGLNLILVDHSEIGQALPRVEQARVSEILEHHRIGDLRTPEPILIHCEPVGATATLVGELYFARGINPTQPIAGILIAAILSDTVGFRSPTTSEKDHVVAARLQPLAKLDIQAFDRRLRQIRTAATLQQGAAAIVRGDFKEFRIGGLRLGIAQVEVAGPEALATRKEEILSEMQAVRKAQGLAQVMLIITDIDAQASDLWVVGEPLDAIRRAFGQIDEHAVHLPGCMSRKKQVVPRLEAVLGGSTPQGGPI
jgi:manganese-dependent inorganic pyrophosphatase